MLQPKRTKFRKMQKGRNRGLAQVGNRVSFGEYGLRATGRGRITARQIEAARRAITRHVKRGGKIWIRIFRNFHVDIRVARINIPIFSNKPSAFKLHTLRAHLT